MSDRQPETRPDVHSGLARDWVWVDGAMVPAETWHLSMSDRGFSLGDGLFETMVLRQGRIRFFDDHMARLNHGAKALALALPFGPAAVESGVAGLAQAQNMADGIVRLVLTRGRAPRGLAIPEPSTPMLLARLCPMPPRRGPMRLQSVSIPRNAGAPSARFKTLSYVDQVAALMEARSLGADDAIMMGRDGRVACVSAANLMVIVDGQALTPPVDDGALPGIIRGRLLRAGAIREQALDRDMLRACQAAVITNSVIGVVPVATLDGRALDTQNPVIQRLLALDLDGLDTSRD